MIESTAVRLFHHNELCEYVIVKSLSSNNLVVDDLGISKFVMVQMKNEEIEI